MLRAGTISEHPEGENEAWRYKRFNRTKSSWWLKFGEKQDFYRDGLEVKMTCPDCRQAELGESRENIRYTESGLPYVTLCNILVERCPACGNTLVNIPQMEQLHRLLANIGIKKSGRLEPFEITFLRKSLGWSKVDFARNMHVRPSQVSHWESEHKPSPMGAANELLLRSLVAHNRRIENYFDEMANLLLSPQPHAQRLVAISHSDKGWFADEAS